MGLPHCTQQAPGPEGAEGPGWYVPWRDEGFSGCRGAGSAVSVSGLASAALPFCGARVPSGGVS